MKNSYEVQDIQKRAKESIRKAMRGAPICESFVKLVNPQTEPEFDYVHHIFDMAFDKSNHKFLMKFDDIVDDCIVEFKQEYVVTDEYPKVLVLKGLFMEDGLSSNEEDRNNTISVLNEIGFQVNGSRPYKIEDVNDGGASGVECSFRLPKGTTEKEVEQAVALHVGQEAWKYTMELNADGNCAYYTVEVN